MSSLAARRLGIEVVTLDASADTPASRVGPAVVGSLHDEDALAAFLAQCEFVSLENEFVRSERLRAAMVRAAFGPNRLLPGLLTLATIQDKLLQRQALQRSGVPVPRAVALEGGGEAAIALGFPLALKARYGGYDGKGNRYAKSPEELLVLKDVWASGGWLAEEFVRFRRELAVMVAIDRHGRAGCFPTVETRQRDSICDLVLPCEVDGSKIAEAAVRAVAGEGLFGVELFERPDGSLLVNEIAPRPHNTGHYTLDWGGLSQFEAHVRLVLGLPMPGKLEGQPTVMANLVGGDEPWDGLESARTRMLAAEPGAFLHWYDKTEVRPGRKVGHINCVRADAERRAVHAQRTFWGREPSN
jgi:5-(carboxyamino)imidazole ribonucleotide synthase